MIQLLILIAFYFFAHVNVHALYDPFSVPNNKYGIHITDPNDISKTASLVNSSGGDWGYVTLVIADNDQHIKKWQEIFNTMRRKHLIPLVRIATHVEKSSWIIPEEDTIKQWVTFLNSLNWPIENRYVIVFNEPNHSKEWGNTIDPVSYGNVLIKFSQALKQASPDFFILPAGFDASAGGDTETLDEYTYLSRMVETYPHIFDSIDGWTSHAYPNPAFSGNPLSVGRGTISTFAWERTVLQSFGVTRTFPIFITETGWQHAHGKYIDQRLLSPETVGVNLQLAANNAWNDKDIIAITPFLFNYQDEPFDHFSFQRMNSSEYYPHYFAYQAISKQKGLPKQKQHYSVDKSLFPDSLVLNSTYTIEARITNNGQAILDPNDGYILTIRDESNLFDIFTETLPVLEPGESGTIRAFIKTPSTEDNYLITTMITHNQERIPIETKTVAVVPPPSADINVKLGWRNRSTDQTATVLIYDKTDTLLHKFKDIHIQQNHITITGLYEVVPGDTYRIVVLVPYYLPRQEIITMKQEGNVWTIKRLYPFDFNRDGKLTIEDIPALLLMPPVTVLTLFLHA